MPQTFDADIIEAVKADICRAEHPDWQAMPANYQWFLQGNGVWRAGVCLIYQSRGEAFDCCITDGGFCTLAGSYAETLQAQRREVSDACAL